MVKAIIVVIITMKIITVEAIVLIDLFLTFVKIGVFTFGGGYAMISLIENACVDNKKWITHDEMMNITVIAESTPGPIAINCATYVGYKKGKLPGAMIATLGMILPSFAIIMLLLKSMLTSPYSAVSDEEPPRRLNIFPILRRSSVGL